MSFPFIFEASVAIILHGGYFINIIIILFMAVKSDNRYEAKDRPRNHNNLSRRHMIHDILNICFHKYNKIFSLPLTFSNTSFNVCYPIQYIPKNPPISDSKTNSSTDSLPNISRYGLLYSSHMRSQ